MEYDKAEANLAKLTIFNPNNVVVLFIRESVSVGQPVTSIKINISGQSRPWDDPPNQDYHMKPEHDKK